MRLLLLLASLAAFAAAPHARAGAVQERRGDPRRAIENYERYLENKPYHAWAFDKLVESAVSINTLEELVLRWEERLVASPDDDVARVVLGRLYARTDQYEEALETLSAVEGKDGLHFRLIGTLEMRRNRTKEAIAALDRAAELSEDREQLTEIHELRGEAYLAAGDRERARAAFHALAELEPESFHLRLEAASALAFHGLHAEAIEEFAIAERLAGEDAERRCRMLSEIGKLHEALSQGEQALAVYREAIAMMARGNWLKRDLYERILAMHKRTGRVDALLERAAADSAGSPQDLDAREFHARVLEETGRRDEARDVLAAAVAEFPSDLKLSRHLIGVLGDLENPDAMIAEYQRILTERPGELDLYLELGQVFASAGRFEQAKRQWQASLEQRLTDAGLAVRLAGFYALYDQVDDAVTMYEKAIELEPAELRHYADLARLLAVRERADEVPAVLDRAAGGAAGNVGRLEELASLWREHGHPVQARAALEEALALSPDDAHLLHRLADLMIGEGEVEEGIEVLHRVVELSPEPNLRRTAVDRILRLFGREDRLEELVEIEEARLAAEPDAIAPRFVLGNARLQLRQPDDAIAHFEAVLERDPANEDALTSLARIAEQLGDLETALARYEELMERKPQTRRKVLESVAQIHLARYDQDAAFACYEEVLAGAPDNPAAFREVANAYRRLNLIDKVAECLRQAVRLEPDDGRTRLKLADAYRDLGELDRAEREVLAAVEDGDPQVRKDARKRYYELVASAGRVSEEIDELRRRIEDNPYDVASPLTLTDIYVREMEYELALEMLEKLLTYQPSEAQLLRERARLLGLMERHEEAIADYEALWKLADADHESLALDIADAALEAGDRQRAAQVLAGVEEPRRVARVYEQKEMWSEAIAAIETGLAHAPADRRLLSTLASLHEKRGDEDAAIAVLERSLELAGDSWRLLTRLGSLYDDVGRKEDVVRVGRRLFALVRVDEADPDDEEETSSSRNRYAYRYRSFRPRGWGRQRASDLSAYFSGKNLEEEFREIGFEEVLRQPTNVDLFEVVLTAMERAEDEAENAQEMIATVLERTLATDRVPPSYTRAGWERRLNGRWVIQYSHDVPRATRRLEELTAVVEAPETALERDFLELARIRYYLKQKPEMIAVQQAGVERFPGSANLRFALADSLFDEKRYTEALPHFEALVSILEENPPEGLEEEQTFQREHDFKLRKQEILQGFPLHIRKRVSDAEVRRFIDLGRSRNFTMHWGVGTVQYLEGARLAWAKCLGKAGRKDEARAQLAALAVEYEDSIADLTWIASAYYALDLNEEAQGIYEVLAARERELSADPLFGFNRTWASTFAGPMRNFARIHEKRGDFVAAYDLLRTYGDPAAGELVLVTNDAVEDAVEHYRALAEERERELADPVADPAEWRDTCVRLAEVHQIAKRWDEAGQAYRRIEERRPDDFEVVEAIARLHERAGRYDDAVATHFRVIERKRERNRALERTTTPPGRVLTPVEPPMAEEDNWAWNNLRNSYRWGYSASSKQFSYHTNYVAILKILLDRRQVAKASEVMRDLAREDVQTFSWLGYSLAEVLQQYQFGVEALPILRMVYTQNSTYEELTIQYGRALVQAKKFDEARRVLTKLRDKSGPNDYYGRQARELLVSLDAREGVGSTETLADLEGAVAADPKSVKDRTRLARRLVKAQDFERALEHALVLEELAPHKDDVKALVRDCLQLCGRQAELEERLLDALDDMEDEEARITAAARLANWAYERGDIEAVDALFERAARKSTGNTYYSAAGWYVQKGEFARAVEILREEVDDAPTYRKQEVQNQLSRVEMAQGDPMGVLDGVWEESFEKASALGDKTKVFTALATPLRNWPELVEREAELRERAAEHEGLRGALYGAAIDLAMGDLAACEERLAEVADPDGETRFLYPVLVTLARTRQDHGRALELLLELHARGVGSESDPVETTIGHVSEKNALRAEIGSLFHELGRTEDALAIWNEMFDEDDDSGLRVKAQLYAAHELRDEAVAMQRRYLEEVGERNASDLDFLADLEIERGEHEVAIELWRRALILTKDNEYQAQEYRSKMVDAYRTLGRLDDFVSDLERAVDEDPDDVDQRKRLARLLAEVDREDEAYAILEGLAEQPGMAEGVGTALMERELRLGNEDRALEIAEGLLEKGMDEYQRQNLSRRISGICFRRGETERGIEILRRGYDDPDGAQAQRQIARALQTAGFIEEAVPFFERAAKLSPDNAWMANEALTLLSQLGRREEVRDRILEALDSDERAGDMQLMFAWYDRELVDELGERERVEAALAADPGDRASLLLAARIAEVDGDDEAAFAHYQTLLARDPADRIAIQSLIRFHGKNEEFDAAIALIDRLLPIVDRLQNVEGVGSSGTNAASLRQQRASFLVRKGDVAAAEASLRDTLGRTYEVINSYSFRYGSFQSQPDGLVLRMYQGLEDWDRCLELYREQPPLASGSNGFFSNDTTLQSIRFYAGHEAQVLDELWRQVYDPASELFSDTDERYTFFADPSNFTYSNDPKAELYRFHSELGTLDELIAKVTEAVERDPHLVSVTDYHRLLLAANEQWGPLIERKQEDVAENPFDPDGLYELAKLFRRVDRDEEALELLETARDIHRGKSLDQVTGWSYHDRIDPFAKRGPVRFSFALGDRNQNYFGSGYSSYGMSYGWGGPADAIRRELCALYRELGRSEEAVELEKEEDAALEVWRLQGWYTEDALITVYEDYGLLEDAERRRLADMEHRLEQVRIPDAEAAAVQRTTIRTTALEAVARMWRKAGDLERGRPFAEERLALFDAEIARADASSSSVLNPATARAALFLRRASFRAELLGELDEARVDLERYLADRDEDDISSMGIPLAWVWYRLGEPERALEAFLDVKRERLFGYWTFDAQMDFGIGFCRIALGERERGARFLRRALARQPDAQWADEARALLEG